MLKINDYDSSKNYILAQNYSIDEQIRRKISVASRDDFFFCG
jgi:hypothetical protein